MFQNIKAFRCEKNIALTQLRRSVQRLRRRIARTRQQRRRPIIRRRRRRRMKTKQSKSKGSTNFNFTVRNSLKTAEMSTLPFQYHQQPGNSFRHSSMFENRRNQLRHSTVSGENHKTMSLTRATQLGHVMNFNKSMDFSQAVQHILKNHGNDRFAEARARKN